MAIERKEKKIISVATIMCLNEMKHMMVATLIIFFSFLSIAILNVTFFFCSAETVICSGSTVRLNKI